MMTTQEICRYKGNFFSIHLKDREYRLFLQKSRDNFTKSKFEWIPFSYTIWSSTIYNWTDSRCSKSTFFDRSCDNFFSCGQSFDQVFDLGKVTLKHARTNSSELFWTFWFIDLLNQWMWSDLIYLLFSIILELPLYHL